MKRFLIGLLILPLPILSQTADEVARMVQGRKTPADMTVDMTMTITSHTGSQRTMTLHTVRKGTDKQISWFLAPEENRGMATLRIDLPDGTSDLTMWMPNLQRMRRISTKNRNQRFMGSDLTLEDMTTRTVENYTYTFHEDQAWEGHPCWVLESVPKAKLLSSYSRILSWVRQSDAVSLKDEYYDRTGNLLKVRTVELKEVKGYTLPIRMFVRNVQKEHTTELLFDNIEVDTGVKDDLFHERNLRRLP